MSFELSCAFATSMATPDHVAVAESLGYRRAWLYDSPALYPDVWVMLSRCADRTSTIGLGPGVLIPSLRHPMTNAAAIATLVDLAGPSGWRSASAPVSPAGTRSARSRCGGPSSPTTCAPSRPSFGARSWSGRARRCR